MSNSTKTYRAIVLAGDRGPTDPVAQAQGAPCKALANIAGVPLVLRVVTTLIQSERISQILIVGPKDDHKKTCEPLMGLIQSEKLSWIEPSQTPCTSAMAGLDYMGIGEGVLITTADHGFLSMEIIEEFCNGLEATQGDTVAGLVPYSIISEKFPDNKRTALRFKNDSLCGCNLFAIKNETGTKAINFWRNVERLRKTPWRIASVIGLRTLVRFLLGRLTVEDAMKDLSEKVGAHLNFTVIKNADAAVDIDTVLDLNFVEQEIEKRRHGES